MSTNISIAYADDHKLIRTAVCELLNAESEFTVVGSFDNGLELLEFAKQHTIDIILLDIDMPVMDGFVTMNELFKVCPNQKIIIVSMHMDESFIGQFMDNGARAFIPKSYDLEQMKTAILDVYQNGIYLDERISHVVMSTIIQTKKFKVYFSENQLSKREIEIIKLMCQEKTIKEIGNLLFIDNKTVEGHRSRIFKKLNVKSAIGVVLYAMEKGIYTP